MAYLDEFKAITASYIETTETVFKKAPLFAGVFGIGRGPKDDPCHLDYYNNILAKAEELAADSEATEQEIFDCTEYLMKLESTSAGERQMVQYMLMTVQGCTKGLIPLLSEEHRTELADWFGKAVPRRMRLPVQNDIFKLLKK